METVWDVYQNSDVLLPHPFGEIRRRHFSGWAMLGIVGLLTAMPLLAGMPPVPPSLAGANFGGLL